MTHVSKRSVPWALLLAAPLLVGASPVAPPPAPAPPPSAETLAQPVVVTPTVQPFDLDATQRMAVKVMVGGQGPFSFLVDTGAERTVIARELAERLGLVQGEKLRLATIGSSAMVPSFRVAMLQMADLRLTAFDAPAFQGRHIGAAGLIGVDMLEQRRVLIDFINENMQILESRKRSRPFIRDNDAIVVTARNAAGRLILSDARIDGRRIDVIVDTGAQSSVGNMALMQLITSRRQNSTPFGASILGSVSGEDVPAIQAAVKRISIEGVEINDMPINFANSEAFRALGLDKRPALLLGMDGLSLFDRVEIDFPNRRVILDLPSAASRDMGRRYAANDAFGHS